MSHRLSATLVLLSLHMLLAGASLAQDAATSQPTEAPPTQTEPDVEDPADIFGPIDDEEPMPANETGDETADDFMEQDSPSEFPQQPPAAGEPADSNTAAQARADQSNDEIFYLRERIAKLETEMEELKGTLRTMNDALANLAEQDSSGLSAEALGAMEELRSDLPRITQGKIRLQNNTGQDQVMYINGTAWTVVPGRSFVYAPVGTVALQIDDTSRPVFKGIQEWSQNSDTGQMELGVVVGDDPSATATERSVLTNLPDRAQ